VATANVDANSSFVVGSSSSPNRIASYAPYSDKKIYWDYGNTTTGRSSVDYTPYLDTWTKVDLTFDLPSTTQNIYLNGTLAATRTNTAYPNTNPGMFFNGLQSVDILGLGTEHKNATMDEFRVSTIARPANWIALEYANQKTGSTLLTIGSEQSNSAGGTSSGGKIAAGGPIIGN
jgi:hypothetical protein